jgi:WD40 repeat protein
VARIFLSHSSKDREQAARLLHWLHAQGFASTFLDFDERRGIAPGADWERTLYREVSSADAVILILTKNWFDSKWCFVEFAQARALGKAIFPLVESPTGETFVSSDIQHLDLVKDREGGLERLRAELTRIAINTRGGFPWDGTRSPFPGLLAFDEADAAIYFGRDDDIRRLIERLNARRAQGGEKLVALLGASGSGKSSLLRAGVVPRLKRDPHNWIALPPFRPQIHPLDELAQAITTGLQHATNWRRWRAVFDAEDMLPSLSDLARDLRAAQGQNEANILLVIDQGEELFGGAERKQAEQFFRVLNALLDTSLPFLAVMALRSDYLGKLQEASGLTASFEEFSLKPMPLERVREIIEGPARVAEIAVDDALVTASVADARTEDALPLLAFALRELHDRSAKSGRLTIEAYRALGDAMSDLSPLENAVRKKADEVLGGAKPAPEGLQALKDAFIPAMVRVNADGEYVRRPADVAAFPEGALPLIESLAKARLLTIRKEQNATLVEVAHEALLRKWPLLRGWLDEEREFLIGKDQLEADLLDWEKARPEQKNEALLAGLKLTRARGWLAAKPLQLTESERRFIQASIARHDAEAARQERARRRTVRGSIAAAAVLALVAAGALWEWRQAKFHEDQAVSRQLAAEAMQDIETDPALALRTAVDAGERSKTDEAYTALNAGLDASRERFILHHRGVVAQAVYSPDGKRIVTASYDRTARIWDAENGHLLLTLAEHTDRVYAAAFSPDGNRVVTASRDETARVWDAESGRLLATLSGHTGPVNTAAFSPDGKRIVTASEDHTARVWDVESGHLLATLSGHTDGVNTAVFSPDSKRGVVVTASDDHTARIWDAESGRLLARLSGHADKVYTAAFSSGGKRIVTASADGTARIWDAESGLLLATLTGHTDEVLSATFSPDDRLIVTANEDGTACVWGAKYASLLATLQGESATFTPDGDRIVSSDGGTRRADGIENGGLVAPIIFTDANALRSAAFSPDGSRIVTASANGTLRIWDTASGQLLFTSSGLLTLNAAMFSPDGKHIVTASSDSKARIWDTEAGQLLVTFSGHSSHFTAAAFSPDGKRIVTASWDHTARIWDAKSGGLVTTLPGHTGKVRSAAFSTDGKRIVTASDDDTARIWDAENGRLLTTVSEEPATLNTAGFSPDGKRIVTASWDGTARIWDAENGRLLVTVSTNAVSSAAFSRDGNRIVTASMDGKARVWDAESGRLLATLSGHNDAVADAEFSPGGKLIVTASHDGTARIWDAESSRLLAALSGHAGPVNSAAFSPDGNRIVTASFDSTARIWDAKSGRPLATLSGHAGPVNMAAFSPDGNRVVTAGGDGTARIYIADFGELLKKAKEEIPVDSGN